MLSQTAELTDRDTPEYKVSIGDASKIIGVPPHTIRYWEKEFIDFILPLRTTGKQRRYGEKQLLRLKTIYKMLKEDGYSIAGAKRALAVQNRKSNLDSDSPESLDPQVAEKIINLIRQQLITDKDRQLKD